MESKAAFFRKEKPKLEKLIQEIESDFFKIRAIVDDDKVKEVRNQLKHLEVQINNVSLLDKQLVASLKSEIRTNSNNLIKLLGKEILFISPKSTRETFSVTINKMIDKFEDLEDRLELLLGMEPPLLPLEEPSLPQTGAISASSSVPSAVLVEELSLQQPRSVSAASATRSRWSNERVTPARIKLPRYRAQRALTAADLLSLEYKAAKELLDEWKKDKNNAATKELIATFNSIKSTLEKDSALKSQVTAKIVYWPIRKWYGEDILIKYIDDYMKELQKEEVTVRSPLEAPEYIE